MSPPEVLTDFELAIILAFPTTEVKGFFFRFAKSMDIHTWAQVAYWENASFVPLWFLKLARHVYSSRYAQDWCVCYFVETWLVGNFSPHRWNVHDMDANSLSTNNNTEGWHNKQVVRWVHSNVYELIEQEQVHTEVSIPQLATGSQPPKRAKTFISTDKKTEELKKGFSLDTISLDEYVSTTSAYTAI